MAPMGLVPHGSPDGSEEVRRNQATFDYIVCNQLFTKAGLRSFYNAGRPISAPVGAMEVKANWVPADEVDSADYYVSEAPDGKKYALIAMHISSKVLPNWTWATFEHQNNPGRCDYTGCHDAYGAVVADVDANDALDQTYSDCAKNDALKAMMRSAGLPPVWEHNCLKGSQTDFISATGLPTHLGNSVTEAGFADTSSCITCHARAAVNAKGIKTTPAGFVDPPIPALCPNPSGSCSPNGAPDPELVLDQSRQARPGPPLPCRRISSGQLPALQLGTNTGAALTLPDKANRRKLAGDEDLRMTAMFAIGARSGIAPAAAGSRRACFAEDEI
ncbi:hypothetical protein ACOJBO_09605 [Rhizobium beringeri]